MSVVARLRSFISWCLLYVGTVTWSSSMALCAWFAPRSVRRRWIHLCGRNWARTCLSVTLARLRMIHLTQPPTMPCIFVSNHASAGDILMVMAALPDGIRLLSKKENFRIPFLGSAMRHMGYIPVDRRSRQGGAQALESARHVLHEEKNCIWMAPEGTRSPDGKLQPFKAGAFKLALEAGVPLVPVWLEGTTEYLRKNSLMIGYRPCIDILVGEPFTEHLHKPFTTDQLSDALRQRMLRLSEMAPNVDNLFELPSYPAVGFRRCVVTDPSPDILAQLHEAT